MSEHLQHSAESVAVPLPAVEAIVGWWRSANEAPGGCSMEEAIAGMEQAVWEMELARRAQYERACQGCGRTVDTNRPCPFCGAHIDGRDDA